MTAFNPIVTPADTSADTEAKKLLANHTTRGVKSTPARTSGGSARSASVKKPVQGSRASGGGKISGGRA